MVQALCICNGYQNLLQYIPTNVIFYLKQLLLGNVIAQ